MPVVGFQLTQGRTTLGWPLVGDEVCKKITRAPAVLLLRVVVPGGCYKDHPTRHQGRHDQLFGTRSSAKWLTIACGWVLLADAINDEH